MRTARIKEDGEAHYHVTARVINREHWLKPKERNLFTELLRQVEGFSGVRVLTHTTLDNHTHIELHVTEREELDDAQFLDRMACLYDEPYVNRVKKQLHQLRLQKQDKMADEHKQKWTYRMHELSEFMKTLKQRYTQDFNLCKGRTGTIWGGRFHSVLLEGSEGTLAAVAAYVDLNATKAGIVKDPKDYPHCGYAEALDGNLLARQGLISVIQSLVHPVEWKEAEKLYRQLLYAVGEQRGIDENGKPIKPGFSREQIEKALNADEDIPLEIVVRCRVRSFTDGQILGSRSFVEAALDHHGHRLKLKTKPVPTRLGVAGSDLYAGRSVRGPAFAFPEIA